MVNDQNGHMVPPPAPFAFLSTRTVDSRNHNFYHQIWAGMFQPGHASLWARRHDNNIRDLDHSLSDRYRVLYDQQCFLKSPKLIWQ
jgi:hypothetical protein